MMAYRHPLRRPNVGTSRLQTRYRLGANENAVLRQHQT